MSERGQRDSGRPSRPGSSGSGGRQSGRRDGGAKGGPPRGKSGPPQGKGTPPRGKGGHGGSGGAQGGARGRADGRGDRTVDQARYDGPPIPEEITGKELAPAVRNQLKGLPEKLAARVAQHLAAAGELIDTDPETAYQHTAAARARAARLAVVREAHGEAAYASGHYREALADLRAAKRMNGATEYLPIMADCHRGLGQPERALELARSTAVERFSEPLKAEMTIVAAGARRDRGEMDAALRTLEKAPLRHDSRESWVVRLRYAYADALAAAGRDTEALEWFHRTTAVDGDEITDAADRAAALEQQAGPGGTADGS